jgi:exopolysaccharide production protein ExoZ
MSKPGSKVITNIQLLRFVAAFMVLMSHLYHEVPEVRGVLADGYVPWTPVFLAGGVDIFFVISGFIMFVVTGTQFGVPGAARNFLVRRIIRVAPPYWIFTAAMLLSLLLFRDQIANSQTSLSHVLSSFLFVPWPSPNGGFYPVLILGYTLNYEMMFYVLFALGLCFRKTIGLRVVIAALTSLAVVGFLAPPSQAPFAFWCNPIVIEFLFGIAVGHIYVNGYRLRPVHAMALILAGFGLMAAAYALGFVQNAWNWRWLWMGVPAAVVTAGAAWMSVESRASRWRRLFSMLGDASFALYLSHPFSLALVKMLWWRTGVTSPSLYILAGAVASILAAIAVFLYIERPVTRALVAIADRNASPRAVSSNA